MYMRIFFQSRICILQGSFETNNGKEKSMKCQFDQLVQQIAVLICYYIFIDIDLFVLYHLSKSTVFRLAAVFLSWSHWNGGGGGLHSIS